MIDELINNGVIKENDKDIEFTEFVGNVVSNVKVVEVEGKTGEERYSTDEKGNEYLNVKAVYSKILKAKVQEKSFKYKIRNEHKAEDKKDKGVEL